MCERRKQRAQQHHLPRLHILVLPCFRDVDLGHAVGFGGGVSDCVSGGGGEKGGKGCTRVFAPTTS